MKTSRIYILIPLALLTLACSLFSPQSDSGEFSGHFAYGFEVSSFVPCEDAAEAAGFGAGYWLSGPPEFYERYAELETASGHDPLTGYLPVYVVFEGEISPAGSYGHLGDYSHAITVTNLIEMSLDGACP